MNEERNERSRNENTTPQWREKEKERKKERKKERNVYGRVVVVVVVSFRRSQTTRSSKVRVETRMVVVFPFSFFPFTKP
tara:strand:- start:100 stop:336 length:237 start_codon:yes stop_codon:yes gene_type:complete